MFGKKLKITHLRNSNYTVSIAITVHDETITYITKYRHIRLIPLVSKIDKIPQRLMYATTHADLFDR